MVRVPYLIENDSYRCDHRARREACTHRDADPEVVVTRPANKHDNLLQIKAERFQGRFEWGNYSKSA